MPNAWIIHVKAYNAKHPKLSYKQAMKAAAKTYKKSGKVASGNRAKPKKQKGKGKPAADVTRAGITVARTGLKYVPGGNIALKLLNPMFDKGVRDLGRWERGERPIDHM